MTYHNFLFLLTAFFCAWAAAAKSARTSVFMLGLASVAVSLVFFDFGAAWAGILELAVCAGLITALLAAAAALARPAENREGENRAAARALPLAAAIFIIAGWFSLPPFYAWLENGARPDGGGGTLWTALLGRRADLLALAAILAACFFAVNSLTGRDEAR